MDTTLITKYNVPVPRYTSYPTVPHWQESCPSTDRWIGSLQDNYDRQDGLSLYIHLPFCESLCTYCGCNKYITKNHEVESLYVDALISEWKIYLDSFDYRPVLKELHLGGGTPTFFAADNLDRLLSTILGDCDIPDVHSFSFEAHPHSTDSDQLMCLYKLGFRRISIGVQDVSPDILQAINRQQSREEVLGLTNWSRSIGYTSVNYDIIYGLPFQRPINVWDTVKFITETKPDRIAFYSYAHVPWKSASQRAFTIEDVPRGIEKSELYDLGRYLLESEGYLPVGMDHFCLPSDDLLKTYRAGTMHRNFMGYTPQYTRCMIALGTSAISDSWNVYVQNDKNVKSYQDKVSKGELPIIKGHVLTTEQQVMRQVILDLMCKDEVYWSRGDFRDVMLSPFLSNLRPLEQDGLVQLTDRSIRVTDVGKFFIRNICASIDPIFQQDRQGRIFSTAV